MNGDDMLVLVEWESGWGTDGKERDWKGGALINQTRREGEPRSVKREKFILEERERERERECVCHDPNL